jgi:hypothetical protein
VRESRPPGSVRGCSAMGIPTAISSILINASAAAQKSDILPGRWQGSVRSEDSLFWKPMSRRLQVEFSKSSSTVSP